MEYGDGNNDEEWEGEEGWDIRPDVGSAAHGIVRPVNVWDDVSRATNGELAYPA